MLLKVNLVILLLRFLFSLMINSVKAAELKHNAEVAAHNARQKTKELAHKVQGIRIAIFLE